MIEVIVEKYGWYILFVAMGLLFRYCLLRYVIYDRELRIKKIAREIFAVIIITILWSGNSLNDNEDTNTVFVIIMLFLGYCFYVLMKKMPKCGYTESML